MEPDEIELFFQSGSAIKLHFYRKELLSSVIQGVLLKNKNEKKTKHIQLYQQWGTILFVTLFWALFSSSVFFSIKMKKDSFFFSTKPFYKKDNNTRWLASLKRR